MFNTCQTSPHRRALLAKDMLQKCQSTSLHRVQALPLTDGGFDPHPLVELPVVTSCTNAQSLRATLHAVLGHRLRGYGFALDTLRQTATLTLHVHQDDVEPTMHSLLAAWPTAQFGRVARVAGYGVRRCR